ncbi:MAG TPA: hypothetical protein VHG51_05540 [Longimicrobiaceae bacterium]|nr:hypothetical protein [Longimicrobiaceae bacterium]
MKRFARLFWAAGVISGLLTGVQSLTAAPSETQRQECGWVWSWQQTMWVWSCGEP